MADDQTRWTLYRCARCKLLRVVGGTCELKDCDYWGQPLEPVELMRVSEHEARVAGLCREA